MRTFTHFFFSSLLLTMLLPTRGFTQNITLTTSPVVASNIAQGSAFNTVYIVKMDVAVLPVTVNSLQFTLTGTHDNDDLITVTTWFNASAPTISGASGLENLSGLFAAPHTYTSTFNRIIAAGASGYFIITVSTAAAATNGNTVKLNGLANPVSFGYTTAPSVTNNQTDIAGTQTIISSAVTLSSSPVAASAILRNSVNNIVYVVKMDVATADVTVNTIQLTLTGTHDNDDLSYVTIYFNATAPTVSGSSQVAATIGSWPAPHTYLVPANKTIAAGASGYFIITVDVVAAATNGNTIKLNGAVNPVVFGFTSTPSITNNQTDAAGIQTIQVPGITFTSSTIAASLIVKGTNNNPVYILKADAVGLPVSINSIQFTLTGTHDNNDITIVKIFFNDTDPTVSGATLLTSTSGLFAAPHTYILPISKTISAGTTTYFIITVDLHASATTNNTIKLSGSIDPVIFGYAGAPPDITNNQSDAAGEQTIGNVLPLTLLSFAGNVTAKQEVQLQWITAGELNTKDFDIEWSADGSHFTKAATVAAAGNSSQNRHYSYMHKLPVDGNNYYRLKMRDIDGRSAYSTVIKINVRLTKIKISVFPNPVRENLQIHVQVLKNETIVLYLHNADGKTIASKTYALTKGPNRLNWDLQQLAPGTYLLSSANNYFETIKIIKD